MNSKLTRTLCVLLALVLMSSTAVSYTYAEYARGVSATDIGRATNWGVTVDVTGEAFATKYVTDTDYPGIDTAVKSSTLDDILAPGTTGTFSGIHCTGTPEVAVRVEISPDLQLTNWVVDGMFYCPLKIIINGTTYSGLDYSSSAAFEEAVEAAIQEADDVYAPNTDLSTITDLNGDYTWVWDFDSTDYGSLDPDAADLTADEKAQIAALKAATDAKDLALQGNASVALSVKCYVYQVDDTNKGIDNDGGDLEVDGEIEWW